MGDGIDVGVLVGEEPVCWRVKEGAWVLGRSERSAYVVAAAGEIP